MAVVEIAGLGPGSWTSLPLGSYQLLQSGKQIFLRTAWHPIAKELNAQGIGFRSFDAEYEQAADFAALHEEIADTLLREAVEQGEIVYAVPGHPGVGEPTVRLLLAKATETGVEIRIGTGHSMLDELLHRFHIDPTEGFLVLDGVQFDPLQANPSLHTIILQTYNLVVAGDLKVQLMEIYPDDFPVTVARAVGIPGEERVERVALYELDRLPWIDHLTVVHLPKTTDERATHRQFSKLVEIVRVLRSPDGCPWDREQTHQSIRKNVIEEAYEVAEAIDLDDPDGLREELGDLLLQVALHGQMAAESGTFSVYDAIQSVNDKLIRRHPHVFGNKQAKDAEAALGNWEEIKRQERVAKGLPEQSSLLESVSSNLPAMLVAYKLQALAAKAGFEWEDVAGVYAKLEEELNELQETEDKAEELGDVLFVLVNLARFLRVDPEEALAKTNQKFRKRFAYIEKMLSNQGKSFSDTNLEEMDRWWNEAKKVEKP